MNNTDNTVVRVSLEQEEICFVIKPHWSNSKNTRDDKNVVVGFYMPRLMSEIAMQNNEWNNTSTPSASMIKNKNHPLKFNPVTTCNYILAEPQRTSNMEQPAVYPGESLRVTFTDNDLKKPRYMNHLVDEDKRSYDRTRIFIKDKATAFSEDKEYEFVMDSRDGIIRIRSNNGRGEFDIFQLEFKTNEGYAELSDSSGRKFYIDSKKDEVGMKTTKGDITITGGKGSMNLPMGLNINAPFVKVTGDVISGSEVIDPGGNVRNLCWDCP